MRFKGTLTDWNDDRGFGFINPAEGGARVFCHISAFHERGQRPANGHVVTYELAKDERGRSRAQQIRYTRASKPQLDRSPPAPQPGREVVVSSLFIAAVLGLAAFGYVPWEVPAWYAGASTFLFLLYGWDKRSARRGDWRTPERTLNAIALAGGWPGGWIAQQAFRHKSRKVSFQVEFWIAVTMNLAALGYLVYSGGDLAALLQR